MKGTSTIMAPALALASLGAAACGATPTSPESHALEATCRQDDTGDIVGTIDLGVDLRFQRGTVNGGR